MRSLEKKQSKLVVQENTKKSLEDGYIRLSVALAGICRTDILVANNNIPSLDSLILGHEICAVVVETTKTCSIPLGSKVSIVPYLGCGECDKCNDNCYELCSRAKMMGLDLDGAYTDEMIVPEEIIRIFPEEIDMRLAAMLEPIAAVLAVKKAIKKDQKGIILGKNRIAKLTQRVLNAAGYHDIVLDEENKERILPDESFDFVVETIPSDDLLEKAVSLVKVGGTIVLKSRSEADVRFPLIKLIEKEIVIKAVRYASFDEAIEILPKLDLTDLFGPIFELEDFDEAFAQAMDNENSKHYFVLGGESVWNS